MTTAIDFDRVETVVRQVMRSIAQLNVSTYTEGNVDKVEDDVDASFFALDYAMPEVCFSDTVTRRCAKTEIYEVLDQVVKFRAENPGVPFYHLFDEGITAEEVMDDIRAMCEEDEDGLDEFLFEVEERYCA